MHSSEALRNQSTYSWLLRADGRMELRTQSGKGTPNNARGWADVFKRGSHNPCHQGETDEQKGIHGFASLIFAMIFVFGAPRQMQAQDNKNPYPSMAPLNQYLMDRDAEIALARSAAPEAISRDAEALGLGRHGYETAVKGKNGFFLPVTFEECGFSMASDGARW